jgi:biotin carboxylase
MNASELLESDDGVVILARFGFNRNFAKILNLPKEKIQVIARQSYVTGQALEENSSYYSAIHLIEKYDESDDVTLKLQEIWDSGFKFQSVTYTSEIDVVRARVASYRLEIQGGMPLADIIVFRDKSKMKEYARQVGIKTPDFVSVRSMDDIFKFVKDHEIQNGNGIFTPPIVLKDDLGMGSEKIFVLRKKSEMMEYLKENSGNFGPLPTSRLIVEKYVEGDVYHIDALISPQGEVLFVWPSRYISPPLSVVSDCKARGDYIMHESNLLTTQLRDYAIDFMSKFPKIPGGAIHLEVFVTPQNEIVLCEIAARVGGGKLSDAWKESFGFDIDEQILKLQAGIPLDINFDNIKPSILSGGILFPANGKELLSAEHPTHPSIKKFSQFQRIGTVRSKAGSLNDLFANALITGESEQDIISNINSVIIEVQEKFIFVSNE